MAIFGDLGKILGLGTAQETVQGRGHKRLAGTARLRERRRLVSL